MSKFADLLRRAGRAEPPRLGFGAAARKPAPSMLLLAVVRDRWRQGVADAIAAGADLVLLAGRVADKELADAAGAADGKPVGLLLPDADAAAPERLRTAGIDFAVLELAADAGVLTDDDLGFALRLTDDLTDVQLRSLESVAFDAVYIDKPLEHLTIARMLDLQRIALFARKRLLVAVAGQLDDAALKALSEMAIAALVVDMHERHGPDMLRELRQRVDALPPPRPRRREERAEALIPGGAIAAAAEDEEDDDYDE
jgi:hypothetical protein